jgi:hypothetical protein
MDSTYKSPVKFVLIDAALKAGHVDEPCSETQFAWAIASGTKAARERRVAALKAVRSCFGRRGIFVDWHVSSVGLHARAWSWWP